MSARTEWIAEFGHLAGKVRSQTTPARARQVLRDFLRSREEVIVRSKPAGVHAREVYIAHECRQALRHLFSPRAETEAGFSTCESIWRSLRTEDGSSDGLSEAFWQDILHIFLGLVGKSRVYEGVVAPPFLKMEGRAAGRERSRSLDGLAREVAREVKRFPSGLEPSAVKRRRENRGCVLEALSGGAKDWDSYQWHLRHIIRDAATLGRIVELTAAERKAIDKAVANRIPFAVTPYYASLFDRRSHRRRDHAVRAQVIPPTDYVDEMILAKTRGIEELDFMGEADTSPVDLVTRRYPQIAILKPFNACAQICVYCQRNWEIEDAMQPGSLADEGTLARAVDWFRRHTLVEEVLITGGDPLMMSDDVLERLLGEFAAMPHIRRIRIGTRTPVVLPMRFTPELLDILGRFHTERTQLTLVTHFEHAYEVTPEARAAAESIRKLGISLYNQQVFTIENSRRFETTALRLALKAIGVDPYYNFFAKGKKETAYYMVPIARILQERQEEARLTPGVVRMDEPVFNVPRLGKNYLRAWQDHNIMAILPDGSRVYEFLPWGKYIYPVSTYVHRDVPIYDYLQRLKARGEDIDKYRNIWYYF